MKKFHRLIPTVASLAAKDKTSARKNLSRSISNFPLTRRRRSFSRGTKLTAIRRFFVASLLCLSLIYWTLLNFSPYRDIIPTSPVVALSPDIRDIILITANVVIRSRMKGTLVRGSSNGFIDRTSVAEVGHWNYFRIVSRWDRSLSVNLWISNTSSYEFRKQLYTSIGVCTCGIL